MIVPHAVLTAQRSAVYVPIPWRAIVRSIRKSANCASESVIGAPSNAQRMTWNIARNAPMPVVVVQKPVMQWRRK